MIIKNVSSLGKTLQRRQALAILEAGYQAIGMQAVLRSQIARKGSALFVQGERIDLRAFRRIGVIGIGKCALEAGQYLERILGQRLWGGMVLDVKQGRTRVLKSLAGTHPLPSEKNRQASERIVRFAKSLDPETDLLICVVSGGGSSLFMDPDGISCDHMTALTRDLHDSGATIQELNCVRKHLSSVQGGKFARMLYPLPIVALYFSDVVSETSDRNLRTIASGPLYPDDKTNADARRILAKYGLWTKHRNHIRRWSETVKEHRYFSTIRNFLLLTNQTMLDAMYEKAARLGLRPAVLTNAFSGRSDSAFSRIKILAGKKPGRGIYLAAGETTVRVRGTGEGGRNQESCLAALKSLKPGELFVSAASDGRDNTDHAGAIADNETVLRAKKLGLDARAFLGRNDSYHFFSKTKDFIRTGLIGSNVSDVMIYMKTQNRPM